MKLENLPKRKIKDKNWAKINLRSLLICVRIFSVTKQ